MFAGHKTELNWTANGPGQYPKDEVLIMRVAVDFKFLSLLLLFLLLLLLFCVLQQFEAKCKFNFQLSLSILSADPISVLVCVFNTLLSFELLCMMFDFWQTQMDQSKIDKLT